MKRLFTIIISLVLFTGASSTFAQTNAKLGYINSAELLQMMPGRDTVEAALTSYSATLENTISTMVQEYQNKVQDYQANVATMSQIIRQAKEGEIVDLEGRIQEFRQSAEQDFQKKRADMLNPLIERAKAAIDKVSKEHGYTYIFDISMGAVIYFETGEDIMPLVKSSLGI